MEISNNQLKPQALEGTPPTKAVRADTPEKNQLNVDKNVPLSSQVTEQQEPEPKTAENLQGAVSQINDYVQNIARNLQFTVDDSTGKDVVTVVDAESEKVIRQIPSEEALELARRIAENKGDGVQLISTRV